MILLFGILCICLISVFFAALVNEEFDGKLFKWTFITTTLFLIGGQLSNNDFKLTKPKQTYSYSEEIYSFQNGSIDVTGTFYLGTGSVNSYPQYSYYVQNSDGSKEKKFVKSVGTKLFETNSVKPKVEITYCTPGEYFSLLKGWYVEDENQKCETREDRKLYVPINTIVMEFSSR